MPEKKCGKVISMRKILGNFLDNPGAVNNYQNLNMSAQVCTKNSKTCINKQENLCMRPGLNGRKDVLCASLPSPSHEEEHPSAEGCGAMTDNCYK